MDPNVVTWMIALFEELAGVSQRKDAYIVDGPSSGWLPTLEELSSAQASWSPGPGRPTVRAQSGHLLYCLEIFLAAENGQCSEPDWQGSWTVQAADEASWQEHLAAVRVVVAQVQAALTAPRDWPEPRLAAALFQVTHTAYHLGALRQVAALAQGQA
jgi:uncharacterized damage-inducible protein DinB